MFLILILTLGAKHSSSFRVNFGSFVVVVVVLESVRNDNLFRVCHFHAAYTFVVSYLFNVRCSFVQFFTPLLYLGAHETRPVIHLFIKMSLWLICLVFAKQNRINRWHLI